MCWLRNNLVLLLLCFAGPDASLMSAQGISGTCKAEQLLHRISSKDTVYVLNFWASWCKPCVEELPVFDSLPAIDFTRKVKVLLVSLDFIEQIQKAESILKKRGIRSQCVLLDETDGNTFIDRFSAEWSGAIPATLIVNGSKKILLEKKTNLDELVVALKSLGTDQR